MHAMICGGRTHTVSRPEADWLDALRVSLPITTYIPGGGKHVDGALTAWAQHHGLAVDPLPADWCPKHSHGALRRVAYLRLLQHHLPTGTLALVALPGGSGTAFMIQQARALGLPVYVYEENAMPVMSTPAPEIQSPVPLLEDDLPEPETPQEPQDAPGATQRETGPAPLPEPPDPSWRQHEALLQGFLAHLMQRVNGEVIEQSRGILEVVKTTIRLLDEAGTRQREVNEHAAYQLSNTLTAFQREGLQLRHDPYTAQVDALSPEGYGVRITVTKPGGRELTEALPQLLAWLSAQGYQAVPARQIV